MTKPNPVGAATRRVLAGAIAIGLVGVAGTLGTGDATADESALIVPGAHAPGVPWMEYADLTGRGYYPNANRQIVDYPGGMIYGQLAQVLPGSGLDPTSVGQSVVTGRTNLDAAIRDTPGPNVAIGLSEGTMVLGATQASLANDPTAPPPDQLSFTVFSDPMRHHAYGHSILAALSPGTYVPILDYAIPQPVESQYDTKVIVAEYDGVADFPDDTSNVLSVLNAIVGMGTSHTQAAFTSEADVPPGNIVTTVNSRGARTTTYLLPTEHLPLTVLLRVMGLPDPVTDQLDGTLRPMVDAGYARHGAKPAQPIVLDAATQASLNNTGQELTNAAQTFAFDPKIQADIGSALKQVSASVPQVRLDPVIQSNVDNMMQRARDLNLMP